MHDDLMGTLAEVLRDGRGRQTRYTLRDLDARLGRRQKRQRMTRGALVLLLVILGPVATLAVDRLLRSDDASPLTVEHGDAPSFSGEEWQVEPPPSTIKPALPTFAIVDGYFMDLSLNDVLVGGERVGMPDALILDPVSFPHESYVDIMPTRAGVSEFRGTLVVADPGFGALDEAIVEIGPPEEPPAFIKRVRIGDRVDFAVPVQSDAVVRIAVWNDRDAQGTAVILSPEFR